MEKRQASLRYKTGARAIKVPARRIDGVYERPVNSTAKKPQVVVKEKPSEIKKSTTPQPNNTYQAPSIHRGSHIVHRVIHEYYQPAQAANSPSLPVVHQQYMPRQVPVQQKKPVSYPSQRQPQQSAQMVQSKPNAAPMRMAPAPVATPVKTQKAMPPARTNSKAKALLKKVGPKEGKVRPSDIIRYSVVTFFVVMAGYLAYDTWQTNQQVQNAVRGDSASAQGYDSSADVSNPPMANGEAYPDYKVAADQPRIIMIPSVNITARMMSVGLTNSSKIDVPADSSFAGWYTGASIPGDKGASFVTGHYNGPNAGGVFDNLGNISVGAEIKIEMGDGSIKKYEVVRQETVPVGQVDMAKALSVVDGEDEGLNIMTCAGSFTGSGFADRLTVYTKRV